MNRFFLSRQERLRRTLFGQMLLQWEVESLQVLLRGLRLDLFRLRQRRLEGTS